MLHLHDTATGTVRPLELRNEGEVSMYVCGPTVYDLPHIGHGRANLTFDILRRYLSFTGLRVHHVANVTDVDDNIIKRAAELGRTEPEVAAEFEARWWESMDALGRPAPARHPPRHAVHRGHGGAGGRPRGHAAWPTRRPTGSTSRCPRSTGYGLLARQSLESLQAGARVEANEDKRSPLDFALWKKAKAGEPSWESPWGPGRPGWHTECVVMSLDLLGEGFDLHGGGQDLMFPHHENERAQAVADGKAFARHWMHNGWVEVEGTKMSKSLGNFTTLPDLLARYDARAYRLLVLRAHYRSPIEVTPETVADAEKALGPARHGWPGASPSAELLRPDADGYVVEGTPPAADLDPGASGRLPGPHGRRPRHARGPGRHLRARHGGPLRAPTPATRSGARAWPARRPCWPPPWACRCGRRTPRSTRSTARLVAERDAGPGGQGLRPGRRPAGRADGPGLDGGGHPDGHGHPPLTGRVGPVQRRSPPAPSGDRTGRLL